MAAEELLALTNNIKGLILTANQYAAVENTSPVPSLWQIHNGNIMIALMEMEQKIKQKG